MGQGCIRFRKPEQILYKLIAEMMNMMTVKEWKKLYEANRQSTKKEFGKKSLQPACDKNFFPIYE